MVNKTQYYDEDLSNPAGWDYDELSSLVQRFDNDIHLDGKESSEWYGMRIRTPGEEELVFFHIEGILSPEEQLVDRTTHGDLVSLGVGRTYRIVARMMATLKDGET